MTELVRRNMQQAMELDVPLVVDDSFGKNWYEVKIMENILKRRSVRKFDSSKKLLLRP